MRQFYYILNRLLNTLSNTNPTKYYVNLISLITTLTDSKNIPNEDFTELCDKTHLPSNTRCGPLEGLYNDFHWLVDAQQVGGFV